MKLSFNPGTGFTEEADRVVPFFCLVMYSGTIQDFIHSPKGLTAEISWLDSTKGMSADECPFYGPPADVQDIYIMIG